MSGNVHSNPGLVFPCSVYNGNVTLLFTSTLTVVLQRNTRLFLFPLLLLSSLTLNAAKSSIPFERVKRPPKPGGPLKWKKRLEKDLRLSLPLTEAMKIVRLSSLPPDVLRV